MPSACLFEFVFKLAALRLFVFEVFPDAAAAGVLASRAFACGSACVCLRASCSHWLLCAHWFLSLVFASSPAGRRCCRRRQGLAGEEGRVQGLVAAGTGSRRQALGDHFHFFVFLDSLFASCRWRCIPYRFLGVGSFPLALPVPLCLYACPCPLDLRVALRPFNCGVAVMASL